MEEKRVVDGCGCGHTCHGSKERSADEKRVLLNRLSRIEGQVRGLGGMVERNAYCVDVLTQVAAVQAALSAFGREVLEAHIRTCVAEDLKEGKEEIVDELMDTLRKFMK